MHQRTRLPHRRGLRVRTGFTILEMLISTTLVLGILTIASNLFRRQSQSLSDSAGRLEAQQNARFGLATLDRELRVAGVGIPDAQPLLVQADRMGFTFNADYVSRVPNDPGAVYIDPDTDSASTLVFRRADRTYLPLSTFTYPESTYLRNAGVPSGAETISFYLARDPQSAATNEHILYRRVNAGTPRIVARGIIVNPADTVFQYFKTVDTTGALAAIPANQLPLYHRAHLHGATNDTGVNARIDSIRSVRVRFAAVHRDRRIGEVVRRLDLTIHLMNAGLVRRTTCGEPPIGPGAPVATLIPADPGNGIPETRVSIAWTGSGDEAGGERDVERYAIYRRLSSAPAFSEPIASIPAGQGSYIFADTDVRSGESWIYGIASQDCTPMSSSISSTTAVTVP